MPSVFPINRVLSLGSRIQEQGYIYKYDDPKRRHYHSMRRRSLFGWYPPRKLVAREKGRNWWRRPLCWGGNFTDRTWCNLQGIINARLVAVSLSCVLLPRGLRLVQRHPTVNIFLEYLPETFMQLAIRYEVKDLKVIPWLLALHS